MSPAGAASALQWWADAGVDCLVDETPRDWLRVRTRAAPPASSPSAAPPAPALPDQLDLFSAYLADSDALAFATPAAPRIMPTGDPAAGLMLIGDMPAAEDFAAGTLIAGEAGRLFDRMLAAIGRDRDSIYLAALSCLRSPTGGLDADSAQACAALARHHIGLVAPKAVLLLGDAPAKALLGGAVIKTRGRWHEISTPAGQIRTLASFAPAYLLAQPKAKAAAWADLQLLMEELG